MPVSQGQVGAPLGAYGEGTTPNARFGRLGDTIVSELMGRYYEQAYRQKLFLATAIVTAPVIFSTAAGTGGPLIWNGSQTSNVVLLAAGMSTSVVTTVAGGIGITGNTGQTAAPSATTAIDSRANCFIGGAASAATPYRVGTVSTAGAFFFPLAQFHTGALTVDTTGMTWQDLGGCIICPPNSWVSLAGSATLSTLVANLGLIYTEVPV